jgi:Protein of unknown function (DUF1800)
VSLSRREFLRLSALVAGTTAASACAPMYGRLARIGAPAQPLPIDDGPMFRRLNRLTFGPLPNERQRAADIGLPAWIEEQLAPEALDDSRLDVRLRPLDALGLSADVLADWEQQTVVGQLRQATLLRRLYSNRQVYERMVDFWTDHFNIYVDKGDCWFLKVVDDREVIRQHALGNFRDLLLASAHSPAMLVYLDNQANDKQAPNENYSREVMELHTLGVGSGYTQSDVMELARCLTGWGVKNHFWRGHFAFDAERHAPGAKKVLGMHIEPAGEAEAQSVLETLAIHPATARHVSTKLVERFVVDQPMAQAPELVARASAAFLDSQGDIQAVLKTILLDSDARSSLEQPAKFKRPTDFVLSAMRLLQAETDGGPAIQNHLSAMGQGLFEWPTPDGAPDIEASWSSNLLPRWSFALELARNEIKGTRVALENLQASAAPGSPSQTLMAFSLLLLGQPAAPELVGALADGLVQTPADPQSELPSLVVAGLLASPAFQWR